MANRQERIDEALSWALHEPPESEGFILGEAYREKCEEVEQLKHKAEQYDTIVRELGVDDLHDVLSAIDHRVQEALEVQRRLSDAIDYKLKGSRALR